jgi:ribosomal protein S5
MQAQIKLAEVRKQGLSDNSQVYNVLVDVGDEKGAITIGAIDRAHAEEIADAINNGACWIS